MTIWLRLAATGLLAAAVALVLAVFATARRRALVRVFDMTLPVACLLAVIDLFLRLWR